MRDFGLSKIGPIRLIATTALTPAHPGYDRLVQDAFQPEHVPSDGVGVWWMEAPFFEFALVGTIADVEAFRNGTPLPTNLDEFDGHLYAKWPNTKGWDELTPKGVTWNEGGEGIVGELGNGEVVVYEYRDLEHDELVVKWHCLICHDDEHGGVNEGPESRYCVAWYAMRHLKNEGHRPPDPHMQRVVAEVAAEKLGRPMDPHPETLLARGCQQHRECARIARLRTLPAA